jgi:hypothetical protein
MKSNLALAVAWDATSLPQSVTTKGSVVFDPREDLWVFRDGLQYVRLDFSELPLSRELLHSLKGTLIWYAENRAAGYLHNLFKGFSFFIEKLYDSVREPLTVIAGVDVLNQRTSLGHRMKQVAPVLRKWVDLGYSGVSKDVIPVLDLIRTKGPETGVAVMTLDPLMGPFSPVEQTGIQDALNTAYSAGRLTEEAFLLTWLFIALGSRPVQIAALKVCDLSRTVSPDGAETYVLQVPRVKQRNVFPRDAFKARPLVNQIGKPLFAYSQRVRTRFMDRLDDTSQAPLFPVQEQYEASLDVDGWAKYHRMPSGLGATLKAALNTLQVTSERTGEPINITPIRFRRTFGTNAAQEGHSVLVIAELLDHSTTESAGVYVAATPELAGRIEKATAFHMAPLAQAFKGHLIKDESEASRGADPYSRIIDLRIDLSAAPMGSCGQNSFCGNKETGLRYSDALCLVLRNDLTSRHATYWGAVVLVDYGIMQTRLVGTKTVQTVFEKFGYKDVNGTPLRLTTRQFRHYLNTLAQMGGLSQLDIAKWSGRAKVAQNAVYDHQSDRDVLAMVRAAIGDENKMFGPLAHTPTNTLITRDQFSALKVLTAHTTDFGYCIHDFSMLPCQIHRDCLNCDEYVCVKGDQVRERAIRLHRSETNALLATAEEAPAEDEFGANRWVEHQSLTLQRLNQLCTLLDDPTVPDGAIIQPAGVTSASRLEQAREQAEQTRLRIASPDSTENQS